MQLSIRSSGNTLHVDMEESFTFADDHIFRTLLREIHTQAPSAVYLDLTEVEFVDSTALGMLLLLRDIATDEGFSLTLQHPRGQVKKMFDLSRFETLFSIV